jgi:hypothetical protein
MPDCVRLLVDSPVFHARWLSKTVQVVGLGLVLAGLGLWLGGALRSARGGAPPGPGPPASAYTTAMLAASILFPLALLPFLNQPGHVIPLGPTVFLAGGALAARAAGALWRGAGLGARSAAAVAGGLVAATLVLLPGPFTWPPSQRCGYREAVPVLRRAALPPGARFFCHDGPSNARHLLVLADLAAEPQAIDAILAGGTAARGSTLDFAFVGLWDYFAPYRDGVLAEVTSDRWELVDAGYQCFLFRRRP